MTKLDLNELTLGQVNELKSLMDRGSSGGNPHPYQVGENYLIRTVTMIYTGKLEAVYANELVLTNACWIADTDRWAQAVADGSFKEQEPYPAKTEVVVGRGAITDACVITFKLPTKQK